MEDMHLILRWHGEKDPISLCQHAQIPNLYGIVTSLYHLPLGQVWDRAEVLRLKEQIEAHGLKFELVDSFRIHEDIKRGYASRDALIENYRKNIRMPEFMWCAIISCRSLTGPVPIWPMSSPMARTA